jgi:hypothetical protein
MDSEAEVVPVLVPVEPPTLSQLPPEGVATVGAALNVTAELSLAATVTLCAVGAVPPAVAVKVRPVGLVDPFTSSVGTLGGIGVVTVRVTGSDKAVTPEAEGGVIETLPV